MATHSPSGVVSTSSVPVARAFPVGRTAHAEAVQALLASAAAIPPDRPLRLAKRTSNLFRPRVDSGAAGLDVGGLTGVVQVDVDPVTGRATADVQGMCTYETLVATTLPMGHVPLVVPQLRTITLGGAVTGLGIESTSFRHGLPHESVLEIDVLTADGAIVTATPDNEHADLFRAFPNSYGSLGYAVRLRIELAPAPATVRLRNVRFTDLDEALAAVGTITATGTWQGVPVDYLDGVVFDERCTVLVLGTGEPAAAAPAVHAPAPHPASADVAGDGRRGDGPAPSDYTGAKPYFVSLRERTDDRLTLHDYLWRWDTDWFWCSRAFGAQHPVVRSLWPASLRRSDVYHRIVGLENRYRITSRVQRLRGRPARERVVQDVELPLGTTGEFVRWFLAEVPMRPLWLCPLRLRATEPWPVYPMRPGTTYVNVGFWGTVPVAPGTVAPGVDPSLAGPTNRRIEVKVTELHGHKSLYSDAYYPVEEFRELYDLTAYEAVRARYDPRGRLLDLYAKTVGRA